MSCTVLLHWVRSLYCVYCIEHFLQGQAAVKRGHKLISGLMIDDWWVSWLSWWWWFYDDEYYTEVVSLPILSTKYTALNVNKSSLSIQYSNKCTYFPVPNFYSSIIQNFQWDSKELLTSAMSNEFIHNLCQWKFYKELSSSESMQRQIGHENNKNIVTDVSPHSTPQQSKNTQRSALGKTISLSRNLFAIFRPFSLL